MTSILVDTVGAQTVDLSPFISANDQALLVYWIAGLGFGGLPCGVLVETITPQAFFTGHTQIPDQGQALLPFAGNLALISGGAGAQIVIDNIGPGAIHISGSLFIFALGTLPLTIPVQRRFYIGAGKATGNVGVAAGATGTILAAPSAGLYYRLKLLSIRLTAAPAAAGFAVFQRLSDNVIMHEWSTSLAVGQSLHIPLDLEWDDGVALNNASGVAAGGAILYEVWQA